MKSLNGQLLHEREHFRKKVRSIKLSKAFRFDALRQRRAPDFVHVEIVPVHKRKAHHKQSH
jgi:hypothetical protein